MISASLQIASIQLIGRVVSSTQQKPNSKALKRQSTGDTQEKHGEIQHKKLYTPLHQLAEWQPQLYKIFVRFYSLPQNEEPTTLTSEHWLGCHKQGGRSNCCELLLLAKWENAAVLIILLWLNSGILGPPSTGFAIPSQDAPYRLTQTMVCCKKRRKKKK